MDDILKNIFGGGFSGRSAGAGGGSRSYHFGGGFGDGFSGGNSGFGDGFSGTGSSFGGRGSDLHADITVSFDEAALGGDKVINLSDPSAPGRTQSLQVHIPAGIDDGQSIRLRGKGQMGRNGQAGDLLLKVKIAEKPGFERKGMDVYTTVQCSVFHGSPWRRSESPYALRRCDLQSKGRHTVRKQDPSARQRYCFHEEPAGTWRSLCDRPGTGATEHYSGSQTQTA